MDKIYLSEDVTQVIVQGKYGVVVRIVHNRDGRELEERTKEGATQREFYCPRCQKTFYTPL